MKRIYWRPRSVSRTVLVLIAMLSLGGYQAVESFKIRAQQPYYREKLAAARLAREAMDSIKYERLYRDHLIDPAVDPAESGLIGDAMTPVTSVTGNLASKQTTINPNFAAALVEMLKRGGVREGDVVAVGVSGSFPALNVCVYAAIETLKLKPVIIASAAASQWGANLPDLMWLDMEKTLYDDGIFSFRSVASSLGGYEDRGLGMSKESRQLILQAIERNGLPFIDSETFAEGIDQRMKIYRENAGDSNIQAYINVGGGAISVGRSVGKKRYRPGLNLRAPGNATVIDSIMSRFMSANIPVIHLVQIEDLATRYGLPSQPYTMPQVGDGSVFVREQYNPWLAAGVLAAIFLSLYAFVLSDLGFRIFQGVGRQKSQGHPEPMI